MPHTHEVFLPIQCEKLDFYELMKEELSKLYDPILLPAANTFYQVWLNNFPHLKIPETCKLGKCDVCCTFTAQIAAAKGNEKKALQAKKKKHVQQTIKVRSSLFLFITTTHLLSGEKSFKSTPHKVY